MSYARPVTSRTHRSSIGYSGVVSSRNIRTVPSTAASRPAPPLRAVATTLTRVRRRERLMRRPQPGADEIDVRLRTRPGWCTAMTCPIIPPSDTPSTWADGQPSSSSTATASSAMSRSV